jgi:hypothetical protein
MYEFFSEYLYLEVGLALSVFYAFYIPFIAIYVIGKIGEKDWFSDSFMKSYKLIMWLCFIGAFFGGTFKRLTIITFSEVFIGVGESIGSLIALIIFPLVLTYIIMFLYNLLKPLLKKAHDKANEE